MRWNHVAWSAVAALGLFIAALVELADDRYAVAQTVAMVGVGVAILSLRDR